MKKTPRHKALKRDGRRKKGPVESCYKRIGQMVLEKRTRSGMTQQQVASKIGWSRAAVSNFEAGRTRVMLHDLPRLAQILCISFLDFIDPTWLT